MIPIARPALAPVDIPLLLDELVVSDEDVPVEEVPKTPPLFAVGLAAIVLLGLLNDAGGPSERDAVGAAVV
jgi:hypothetical protein